MSDMPIDYETLYGNPDEPEDVLGYEDYDIIDEQQDMPDFRITCRWCGNFLWDCECGVLMYGPDDED